MPKQRERLQLGSQLWTQKAMTWLVVSRTCLQGTADDPAADAGGYAGDQCLSLSSGEDRAPLSGCCPAPRPLRPCEVIAPDEGAVAAVLPLLREAAAVMSVAPMEVFGNGSGNGRPASESVAPSAVASTDDQEQDPPPRRTAIGRLSAVTPARRRTCCRLILLEVGLGQDGEALAVLTAVVGKGTEEGVCPVFLTPFLFGNDRGC